MVGIIGRKAHNSWFFCLECLFIIQDLHQAFESFRIPSWWPLLDPSFLPYTHYHQLPASGGKVVKNPPTIARDVRRGFNYWVGKIPWSRKQQPAPVFLPGKSRGQRSLKGYNAQGCEESDAPEHTGTPSLSSASPYTVSQQCTAISFSGVVLSSCLLNWWINFSLVLCKRQWCRSTGIFSNWTRLDPSGQRQ